MGAPSPYRLVAVREFADKDFHTATVRSIADRSGIKRLNAIVYYYGGKEGLYQVVFDFIFSKAKCEEKGQ